MRKIKSAAMKEYIKNGYLYTYGQIKNHPAPKDSNIKMRILRILLILFG